MQAQSDVYNAASETWARQMMALCRAAVALNTAKENAQIAHVGKLLSAMLHPEVEQRMSAEEMAGLEWLQEAATCSICGCALPAFAYSNCAWCNLHEAIVTVQQTGSIPQL